MHPDLVLASRLQALDQRITSFEKEIATLPKHIAEIEKQLDTHMRRLELDKAALAANLRDRKKLEAEVETARQKASKLRDQMMSAKTNEQYKAFQHEIGFLDNEVRSSEDRVLDLMGAAEPLDAAVKKAEAAFKLEKQQVEQEKTKTRERTAVDETALAEARAERVQAIAEMAPALVTLYEKIKKRWGPTVVVEVDGELCKGCKLTMRPQFQQDLRVGDKLMQCENCGRLLIYNPPVSTTVHFRTL
jgi:uncharacterized protein